MSLLTRHPLLVFGLGFAAGLLAHRYRKPLVQAATEGAAHARAVVQRQTAHLEEIAAAKHH